MTSNSNAIAILLTDASAKPLEEVVTDLYGADAGLGPLDVLFDEAVCGARPSAVTWVAHHWFFDMANVITWFDACPIKKGPASIFVLDPEQKWYGYGSYMDGETLALQFGTDEKLSQFHWTAVLSAIEYLHKMAPFGEHRDAFEDLTVRLIL